MFSYRSIKQLIGASAAAILLAGSGNALALTAAGDTITNTASVTFKVSGATQVTPDASDSFDVDTRVDVDITSTANGTVAPSATASTISLAATFTLTTESNANMRFDLSAENATGDAFDLSSFAIYKEVATAGFNSTDDGPAITFLDVTAGTSAITLYVVGTIPDVPTVGDTDSATIHLIAKASTYTTGAALTEDAAPDKATGSEIVFATAAGSAAVATGQSFNDVANDEYHSASATYTVASADLTFTKTSAVTDDGAGGTYNIPGATVEYTIYAENTGASAVADNFTITDALPATMTFLPHGYGTDQGISVTRTGTPAFANDLHNSANTTASNNISADFGVTTGGTLTVTGSGMDLDPGETITIKFKASIN